jgi:peptidoglycan/LPS O-acetylase OafA/YrhL
LLALSVVCAHTAIGRVFTGSALAVQLFYMVSGFLIAHVLVDNASYRSKARFWASRALRLYPIYLAVAALALLNLLLFDPAWFTRFRSTTATTQWFMATVNLTLFGQDWAMFMRTSPEGLEFATDFLRSDPPLFHLLLVPQAWSLGVELSFYMLAPFILRRLDVMLLLLGLSLAVRLAVFKAGLGWQDPWTYRFFPAELGLFLLGALSRRLVLPRWQALSAGRPPGQADRWATMLAVTLCVLYASAPLPSHVKGPGLVLVMVLLLPATFLFNQRATWDRYLGELSYPVYVVHVLLIQQSHQIAARFNVEPGPAAQAGLVLVASLVLAHALNRGVQAPVERWRSRIKQTPSTRGTGRAAA